MLQPQNRMRTLKAWLLTSLLVFTLALPGVAAARDFVNRIVVFGTSLSDPGNFYAWTGQNLSAPNFGMFPPTSVEDFLLIPDAPYALGGNRFSNGPTWIEQLAKPVGLAASVRPAMFGTDGVASNYAVGGARAYVDPNHPEFAVRSLIGLSAQVGTFLNHVGYRAPSNALYIIEMGGNDIRDVLAGEDPAAVIGGAVTSIAQSIGALHYFGARRFLVWHVPNLGRTPAILASGPAAVAGAAGAGMAFNAGLSQALGQLSGLEDIEIVQFNAFEAVNHVATHPRKYGLLDSTTACIKPGTALPSHCPRPDRHLFWDGIHPTRAGHGIIAFLVARTLVVEALRAD